MQQEINTTDKAGYSVFVDGEFILSNSVGPLYKMLSRIELQLSDRCDKTIRRLMDEAREVLKNARQEDCQQATREANYQNSL